MRIIVADDHDLVREMISDVLTREAGCVVWQAESVDEVMGTIEREGSFDLILLDYNMPGMNGFDGLTRVKYAANNSPVAIISGVANKAIAEKALTLGAAGFLPKTVKPKSLVNAVRFMASGEVFVPVAFLAKPEAAAESLAAYKLTEREVQVLGGLAEGMSNKQIALRLDLQEVTIKLHVKTLCRKLGAANRTLAALKARELGLVA